MFYYHQRDRKKIARSYIIVNKQKNKYGKEYTR